MFEKEILDMGFVVSTNNTSFQLVIDIGHDIITFLYINYGGRMFYELYGNKLQHNEVDRESFIRLINSAKSIKRDKTIDSIITK